MVKREKLIEFTLLIESKNFNLFTPFGGVALPLWATLFGYRAVDGHTTEGRIKRKENFLNLMQTG